jgi:hypothetical protein
MSEAAQEDAQDSILHTLFGRLRNPFYASFVLAWVVTHWEAFYITFFIDVEGPPISVDGERYSDKLAYIDAIGYTAWSHLLPIVVALVLPMTLQWVGGELNLIHERIEKRFNERRREALIGAFVPVAERDAWVTRCNQLERDNSALNERIRPLQEERNTAIADHDGVVAEAKNLQSKLDDEKAQVRKFEQAQRDALILRGITQARIRELFAEKGTLDTVVRTFIGYFQKPDEAPELQHFIETMERVRTIDSELQTLTVLPNDD